MASEGNHVRRGLELFEDHGAADVLVHGDRRITYVLLRAGVLGMARE
ncbi:hypothetical protein [Catellatospora sichuanensis]|nr:hypothetical protein [Catellatospora sichuanensis]